MRQLDKSKIHKILVISLSNIGDVVLTLPVVDILRRDFPKARISIVIGPKAESLLKGSLIFEHVFIYDKHQTGFEKLEWIKKLRKERFDLAVDLRNSAIPFLIGAKNYTPLNLKKKELVHMKTKHLNRLRQVHPFSEESAHRDALCALSLDQIIVEECLQKNIGQNAAYAVMVPGSADQAKRWSVKGFAQVADFLHNEYHVSTIFLGDQNDIPVVDSVQKLMTTVPHNLCGQTNLIQTAEFIRNSKLVLANDSAALHIASYLNRPVIALFGYTDPIKYGPWSQTSWYLKASGNLPKDNTVEERIKLIESIQPEDVIRHIHMMMQENNEREK
ncbi:MAG: glycosyltransferase family 9 protein [Candidatus Omnitrophica bacterium]|nr:glycosyltransferase family 9 protein [Candidatus Omnitrophota bacterium]